MSPTGRSRLILQSSAETIKYTVMNRYFIAALLLWVMAGVFAMPAQDRIFPGDWSHPTANVPEEAFEWKPDKYSFETSTLFMLEKMDSGGWLIVYFFKFRIPVAQKWGLIVTHVEPDGKRHFFKAEIPENEIETRPGSAYIRLGKNVFEGSAPNYRASLDVGGLKADLKFSNKVPTWRPGSGVMYYTEDESVFNEIGVMLPMSRVTGKLVYDGVTIDTAGWGYGDRAFTNLNYFKQNEMIYAVRGFPKKNDRAKHTMSMLEYKTNKAYGSIRIPWIIIMSEDGYLVATKDFQMKPADFRVDKNTGYSYPWQIEMTGRDGDCSFRLVSRADRLDEVLDVIEEFPPYLRPLAKKFFSRPVFYRFSGKVTGEIVKSDGSKIPLDLEGYSEVTFIQKN